MNIFFGLCGEGSRFKEKGYTLPKYLIPYNGSTMLYHSVETLKLPGKIHFVVKEEHLLEYSFLEKMLLTLGDEIIICYKKTEGAAQSLLLAESSVTNLDDPFVSVNCDQYLDWSPNDFINTITSDKESSYILTYKETSPKCSYVKCDYNGNVIEVREKKVISNDATIGVYHWAHTRDFFTDAKVMIESGIKENNEYYVAPVYNWSIKRGLIVKKFEVEKNQFWPVGTVDDLDYFLINNKNFL